MKINIGYMSKQSAVMLDTEKVVNSHILCIGASGSGKTVEAQHIISDVARQGGTVLAISTHSSLSANQIFDDYAEDFERYGNHVYVSKTGIPCQLFTPVVYSDGSAEAEADMTGAIVDILCRAFKLGNKDRILLRHAVEYVAQEKAYQSEGFQAIGKALMRKEEKGAEELYERLRPLFLHNVFTFGDSFIKEGCINVIHLDRLDLQVQDAVTEMLLAYIWRLANTFQFETRNIYLFLDECQNVNAHADGALALLLSEGRKMGVRLILATQMLLQGNVNSVQARITQCGTILIFKPAVNCIAQTAKMVDPVDGKRWHERLRTLKVGEFIACGSFVIAGRVIDYPIVVNNQMKNRGESGNGRTGKKPGGAICKTSESE